MKENSTGSNYKLIFVLSAIIISFAFFSLAELKTHDFEGKCGMCHLVDEEEKVFEDIFVKDVDSQCGGCHSDLGLSHPTGMKPTMTMPPEFNLDSSGRLTCATCHEVHGEGNNLLIVEKKRRIFCYLCHSEGISDLHSGVGADAHSASKYEVTNVNILIDDLSVECISCHDGALSKSVNIGMGSFSHGSGGSGHPIGVDYLEGYAKGDMAEIQDLDVNIKFYDGKIGCGTCHNMYSRERYLLAKSNNGSGLCLECHRK